MTYYKDFTEYKYFIDDDRLKAINIGWLSMDYEYKKGKETEIIQNKLWDYCTISINQTRGLHECEFCKSNKVVYEENNGTKLLLGSAEIRVFGENNIVYAAPNLLYHYVKKHNFKMPKLFIDALFSDPNPKNKEYTDLLDSHGYDWNETPINRVEDTERFKFIKTTEGLIKKIEV